MKKDKMLCDPTLLSRFIDEEIEPDQYIMISNHIKHCPSCLEFLQENHSLSTFFKKFLEKELSHIHVEDVEEQVLDLIKRERVTWWIKLRDFFASKRFYVPATTMATVLLIFLTLSRYPATVCEPSAIVNSFK